MNAVLQLTPPAARLHSPLPWTLVDNGWEIWDANERSIACVGSGAVTAAADAQARVDAELLVRSVNAHTDLIDTLDAIWAHANRGDVDAFKRLGDIRAMCLSALTRSGAL